MKYFTVWKELSIMPYAVFLRANGRSTEIVTFQNNIYSSGKLGDWEIYEIT